MKTLDSKSKSLFERVEPGLFRYKPSGSYYTVLKKDGKTKWRNLKTTDKAAGIQIDSQSLSDPTLVRLVTAWPSNGKGIICSLAELATSTSFPPSNFLEMSY